MKNLIKKVRHHGKKITVHLKSQPKWVVRCMLGIGAILGLALSLHAHPIGGTNAQSIECPEGQYLATGDVCVTNEKDIVIQVTATEANQRLTINKYFANDFTVNRGDGTTGEWATGGWILENIISHTTHTYSATGTYNITLSLSGVDRWTFQEMWGEISYKEPLVPISGTTVTDVQIIYMPSLTEGFGDSAEVPGDRFFSWFNNSGAITSLPEGSFNTSQITTAGDLFFFGFNCNGKLTSLPIGSFNISNISGAVGDNFFSYFNNNGALTSLPIGSFNTSQITTAGDNFFSRFDYSGALTSLPEGSFNISNISGTVGGGFFSYFNTYGQLTSLPTNSFDTSNIKSAGDSFFVAFNNNGALTSLPDGSFNISQITTAGDLFFTMFNSRGALTSLPVESFDTSNITSAGFDFFHAFNYNGKLTSLPDGSFNTSKISGSVGQDFFSYFNYSGNLTSLPEGSFDTSNITTVGDRFFSHFNSNGVLTSLPDSFTLNSTGAQSVSGYMNAFYSPNYTLNKRVSDLVGGIVAPGDYRDTFSSNQPGRCGVHENWLKNKANACLIVYDANGGTGTTIGGYESDSTIVEAGTGITLPTRVGYSLSGWQDASGNNVEEVIFPDMDGQTLYARWIDNIKPTCNVAYNPTGSTTGNVVASLTGCSETITGTDLQHTFTGNGTYTFNFQDLAGNTGTSDATVTWIYSGNNTIYYDTNGNEFRWGDLTICNPSNSRECITMMDRNLGATTNNISRTGSFGYYYQWGNNYGFLPDLESLRTGENPIDASSYGPGNYYSGNVYIISPRNEIYQRDRSTVRNDNLWGGSGDNFNNNYLGYPVPNPTDRQGPCPDGYHVPSMGERFKVMEWRSLNYSGTGYGDLIYPNNWGRPALSGGISRFRSDFYIPESKSFYINRYMYEDFYDIIQDSLNFLRTSSPIPYSSGDDTEFGFVPRRIDYRDSRILYLDTLRLSGIGEGRDLAVPVRCFKNNTGYNSVGTGLSFSISITGTINAGEYTNFSVKVMNDGVIFTDYTGTVYFELIDKNGNLIDRDFYEIYGGNRYKFEKSNYGRKTFSVKVEKNGTYILRLYDLSNNYINGSELITVLGNHSSANFGYDTLKFNPYYSDEMNEAYQYSRYYDITTTDSIKEANMYGGLNRIAMAKMLTNYAENVLGIKNYDTSRNCKFVDVSTSLDKKYDYGVTKACQLGIMGVNMPNNKFYPDGGVTRAEFATALSRLLYNTKDGATKYYSTHISKLYKEGIITNTDPTLRELRGYVMLMLKRASEE